MLGKGELHAGRDCAGRWGHALMFQHQGIWFPDGEKHFPDWMNSAGEIVDGKGTYQIKKLRAALEHCKQFRVAVDVGAHVGMWTMQLQKIFRTVHAFEPVEEFRKCFIKNVAPGQIGSLNLHCCALGASESAVAMHVNQEDTGGTHVSGDGDVPIQPMDIFGFDNVDFIKIDCEGYEHHVINGARETILRCKPCIIVEQKQHIMQRNYGTAGTPAVDLLKEMGAEVREVLSGDYILSW
jgi:FkbM family methyltransferase